MVWYGMAWHGAATSLVSYALPLTCVTDPIVYRASIIISPTHHGRQEVQGRANCVESAVSSQWHLWLSVECGFFSSSSLDTDTQHTQNEIVPSIEPHSRRLSSPLLSSSLSYYAEDPAALLHSVPLHVKTLYSLQVSEVHSRSRPPHDANSPLLLFDLSSSCSPPVHPSLSSSSHLNV
jgi:hypothetical protein